MKKKNILISQNLWVSVLFIFTSLCHVSCKSCSPAELSRDSDSEIAKITIESQEVRWYINGAPLVEIGGEITEKRIEGTSKLCLLVIPKGKINVKEAIASFLAVGKDPGTGNKEVARIPFFQNKDKEGAVYYIKEVPGPETGKLKGVQVFVDQLKAGEYETYLLLHTSSQGTVFSNNTRPLTILPKDPAGPSIELSSALATINKTKQDALQITATAPAKNLPLAGEKGWFLFVDQKETTMKAAGVIADFLKSESNTLPTSPVFTPGINGKAWVHPFTVPATADNKLDVSAERIFQRGATYQISACLFYQDTDGNQQYVVSEAKDMVIPKPVVELKLQEAKITELIKCLDDPNPVPNIDTLSIYYEAEITKEEGTSDPQIGLLYVQGAEVDSKAGSQKIDNLLQKDPIDNYYANMGDLVYLIGNDKTKLKQKVTTSSIPLKLGVSYHVYFFLKDGGGEIFLSKDKVELTVPSVKLEVTKFKTGKGADKFTVHENHQVENPKYSNKLGKKTSTGYMIVEQGKAVEQGFLKQILQNTNGKDTEDPKKSTYKTQLGDATNNFMDMQIVTSDQLTSTCESIYKETHVGKPFDVYLVNSCENALFWITAPNTEKFIWYELYKVTTTQGDIKGWKNGVTDFNNKKYQFSYKKSGNDYTNATIYEIDNKSSKIVVELNNKNGDPDNNEDLIKKLVGYVIEGEGADVGIANFMSHMQKVT